MVRVRPIILVALLGALIFGGCLSSDQKDDIVFTSLVQTDELKNLIDLPNVRLVDLRPNERFIQGHIPNAIQLWRTDIEDSTHTTNGIRASLEHLEHLLQMKGLNDGDHIVIYDDKGDVDAARLWWLLKLYDYPKVSLLNGGLQAWKNSGLPVTSTVESSPVKGDIRLGRINYQLLINKAEVLASVGNNHYKIIDTRSSDEYSGYMQKTGAARPGRIPGSIFLEYSQTLDHNGLFLEPKELEKLFSNYGIIADDSLIIYCQTGVRSSHLSFVLTEIMGYQNVANYDGSWVEWSHDDELPIELDSISFTMN